MSTSLNTVFAALLYLLESAYSFSFALFCSLVNYMAVSAARRN